MTKRLILFPLLLAGILCGSARSARAQITTRTSMSYVGVYSGSTTYAKSDVVTEASSVYLSLVTANVGHDPASSPSQWLPLGASTTGSGSTAGMSEYDYGATPTATVAGVQIAAPSSGTAYRVILPNAVPSGCADSTCVILFSKSGNVVTGYWALGSSVFGGGGGGASLSANNTWTGTNTYSNAVTFTGADNDSLTSSSGFATKAFYDQTGSYMGGVGYSGSATSGGNPTGGKIYLQSSGAPICLNTVYGDTAGCGMSIDASNIPKFAHAIVAPNVGVASTLTYTAGTGVGTISCSDAAGCNSLRATVAIPVTSTISGGASPIATFGWTATASTYHCDVTQNGGTAFYGIGNLGTSTTGVSVITLAGIPSGTTVYVNLNCRP